MGKKKSNLAQHSGLPPRKWTASLAQVLCNVPPLKRINHVKVTLQLGKDGNGSNEGVGVVSLEVCPEKHRQESVASPMVSLTLGEEDMKSEEFDFESQTVELKKHQVKNDAGIEGQKDGKAP